MFKVCELVQSRYGSGMVNECNLDYVAVFITFILSAIFIIVILMAVLPIYNVWQSRKRGEAELAEANYEQQIQIATATARYNAAEMNKKAAIVEAEAVKAQIDTIGESLKTHDLYLRWQWIKMMEDRNGETIYVPTECNLPILEARNKDAT